MIAGGGGRHKRRAPQGGRVDVYPGTRLLDKGRRKELSQIRQALSWRLTAAARITGPLLWRDMRSETRSAARGTGGSILGRKDCAATIAVVVDDAACGVTHVSR